MTSLGSCRSCENCPEAKGLTWSTTTSLLALVRVRGMMYLVYLGEEHDHIHGSMYPPLRTCRDRMCTHIFTETVVTFPDRVEFGTETVARTRALWFQIGLFKVVELGMIRAMSEWQPLSNRASVTPRFVIPG